MRTQQLKAAATLLILAATATLGRAGEPTLKVGDPAPKLQTGKWVQGDPVTEFQKGKAYIVEFWATWCGPCRVSIPHLNEIYNKYKDQGLVVIGQDCWERDENLVGPFLKSMGAKMTYRVALDDKQGSERGKMAETWMSAAGRNGIPSAFLVDTAGLVAWIGHPMQLKDKLIEEVLAGRLDIRKAAADYATQQKNEGQLRTVWTDINRAMQAKNWEAAIAKLAEAEKLVPEDNRSSIDMMRFNIFVGKKDYPAANKVAQQLSETNLDNAMLQNQLAWMIATDPRIEQRDLNLAETIATRANAAAKNNDAAILDTLARILFMQGKKDKAIQLQEKAVSLTDSSQKKSLQATLDSYKKGELPKAD